MPAGEVVIRQGEQADSFYVIIDGQMSVTASRGGQAVAAPDMSAGDYFGEIGLIERIPRTATVTVTSDARVLRVDGAALLEALTAGKPSAAIIDGAAVRLGRTHSSLPLSQAGLQGEPT